MKFSWLPLAAELKLEELQKQVSSQGAQLQKAESDVHTARSSEEALLQSIAGLKADVEASQYVQGFSNMLHDTAAHLAHETTSINHCCNCWLEGVKWAVKHTCMASCIAAKLQAHFVSVNIMQHCHSLLCSSNMSWT